MVISAMGPKETFSIFRFLSIIFSYSFCLLVSEYGTCPLIYLERGEGFAFLISPRYSITLIQFTLGRREICNFIGKGIFNSLLSLFLMCLQQDRRGQIQRMRNLL